MASASTMPEGAVQTSVAVVPPELDQNGSQGKRAMDDGQQEVEASDVDGHASKKIKFGHEDDAENQRQASAEGVVERRAGVAPVKAEFLIPHASAKAIVDDDAAEASGKPDDAGADHDTTGREGKRKKRGGQNKERTYGSFDDEMKICNSVAFTDEFSPRPCTYGDKCSLSHDLRLYLKEGRRADIQTEAFDGKCSLFETYGRCPSGWKCRFVNSHSKEIDHDDGRKELVLIQDPAATVTADAEMRPGLVNVISGDNKRCLAKKKIPLGMSDTYLGWMNEDVNLTKILHNAAATTTTTTTTTTTGDTADGARKADEARRRDVRAQFVDPPLKASEKRRIYFGRETPVLAPLTTQGNLPFRRLCVELGAQVTYSEMALSMPLLQGQKGEWALMKAHESETRPPRFTPAREASERVVDDYSNSKDLKFGAQIAGSAPWMVIKATEALTSLLPHLRVVDLNCGCPIDMVFNSGAGSSLLDAPPKLERMVRGMNVVSGEVPITVKLRTGVRAGKPNASKLIERLAFGGDEQRARLGAPGTAAITLHGRSRQQRYAKKADWSYIAECAALIRSYNDTRDDLTDTAREADAATQANSRDGKMYFLGNGDCYSHVDYFTSIDQAGVDSVMIARGALIKPWIFEEIDKGQYLDKSASERLAYIDKFVRYGLETWGSDELGVGFTRRFLLEWLSFTHRYVPIGLLDHLPPNLSDRPPAYRGRNELETLLASDNYRDWIKISDMFLGRAPPSFKFQPKHKSHSYDIEAEG